MNTSIQPELKDIPIEKLVRGQYQPRRHFDPTALQALADSIKANGLIQPLIVRPIENACYEIIAGERRWRACQIARLPTVRCLITNYTNEQTAIISTLENIQRLDLNPIEEAKAYKRLIEEFNYTHEILAHIMGKGRSSISNALRLLDLENGVQQYLIEGKLQPHHGKLLAGLPLQHQLQFAHYCIQQGWSIRKLEKEIKKRQQVNYLPLIKPTDPNVRALENLLSEHLNTEVKIEREGNQPGWLKIKFYDNSTLDGLLQKIGVIHEHDYES